MLIPFRGLIAFFALFVSFHNCVFAQSDFTVAGGDATGDSGYLSYSIGQVSFESYSSNEGNISLGVQQSHIKTLTLGNSAEESHFGVSLYPNPARNDFQIKWLHDMPLDVEAELYDVFGRKLKSFKIKSDDERFAIASWPPGIYFIRIFQNQTFIKSIKLIKS